MVIGVLLGLCVKTPPQLTLSRISKQTSLQGRNYISVYNKHIGFRLLEWQNVTCTMATFVHSAIISQRILNMLVTRRLIIIETSLLIIEHNNHQWNARALASES